MYQDTEESQWKITKKPTVRWPAEVARSFLVREMCSKYVHLGFCLLQPALMISKEAAVTESNGNRHRK